MSTTTTTVTIGPVSITVYPEAWPRDGFWRSDAFYWSNDYLTFGYVVYQHSTYIQFDDVTVRKGVKGDSVYIYGRSYSDYSDIPVKVRIYGVLSTSDTSYPNSVAAAEALPLTTAYVDWDITEAWTDEIWYASPDLCSIFDEVVAQEGWESGCSILLVIKDRGEDGVYFRRFDSYDFSTITRPQLHITTF